MSKNVCFNKKYYNLTLADTDGQEEYDRLRPLVYHQADVFMLCFSVSDPTSFDHIASKWWPEIAHHSPSARILLVGLKSDLRDQPLHAAVSKKPKFVSNDEAIAMCQTLGAYKYVECSSLKQDNVSKVFDAAISATDAPIKKKSKKDCALL